MNVSSLASPEVHPRCFRGASELAYCVMFHLHQERPLDMYDIKGHK